MKKFLHELLLLSALVISGKFASAQSNADFTKQIQVVPPSPVTYKMSKYGGINSSLITGTPNISIPLLSYNVKSIGIQLSLNYSSSGVKVDEVAGRTGMGWNLTAGGTISRIIYDLPDELGMQETVPTVFSGTETVYNFFQTLSQENSYDMQPDIYNFSFGGYGGKFIVVAGVVKQIVKSSLKIEANKEGYDFRITTPDGTRYYFGGVGATEISNTETDCDRHSPSFPATAWQLSKIVAYTGETVNFSYLTYISSYPLGINETITRLRLTESNTSCYSNNHLFENGYTKFCASRLTTHYCVLAEISSNLNGRVKLSYITRTDLPGERLLSKIRYFSRVDSITVNKYIDLAYVYSDSQNFGNLFATTSDLKQRAFLTNIKEYSGADELIKKHSFSYDDIDGLPTRLSFSQDLYGYFNGKTNLSHIVPKMDGNPNGFPVDLADRSDDFNYAKKGLLTKISYPTGGQDSIIYEPNTVYGEVKTIAPILINAASGFGIGSRTAQIHNSTPFTTLLTQTATINIVCEYVGDLDFYLPSYNFVKVEVIDQTDSQVVYEQNHVSVDENITENIPLEAAHEYVVKVTAYGENVFGNAELNYKNAEDVVGMQNVNAPGIRIQKVITSSNDASPSQTKKFYYGTPQSGYQQSSGEVSVNPEFYVNIEDGAKCYSTSGSFAISNGYYDGLYSYAINTQYLQQTPVQYRSVAESEGENFENGGTAHEFLLQFDTPGEPIWGGGMPGAPLSNYGIMNGLETKVTTLLKKESQLLPIKIVETFYKESQCNDFGQLVGDSCIAVPVYGYVVRKNYITEWGWVSPTSALQPFHATRYKIMGSWFYADTVKTTEYDIAGNNPIIRYDVYQYNNPLHAEVTRHITSLSTGQPKEEHYYYPYDALTISGLTTDQIAALDSLTSRNRISAVQTVTLVDEVQTLSSRVDFKQWSSGLVLPERYLVGKGTNVPEERVTFDAYDGAGNLLGQSQKDGPKTVYLYSYQGQFPIAEIKNADYAAVESALGGAILVSNFNNEVNPDKAAIDAFIAPLRASLPAAQISVFTYEPLVGIKTATDAKGMTTFYEYDSYQRLELIKDQNGNIVKRYAYHYKN